MEERDICKVPSRHEGLTFELLKNYLNSNGFPSNEGGFAKDLHLLTDDGRYNLMAEILSDKNDLDIHVDVYRSIDESEFSNRESFGGVSLLYAMERAMRFVSSLNRTYVKFDYLRVERTMFDRTAFDEAWINACLHNDWSGGKSPHIDVYLDRLEIRSYGGLPDGLSEEGFFEGKGDPVNPELREIFHRCGFNRGGLSSVLMEYGRRAFVFSPDFIDVVIPFDLRGFKTEEDAGWLPEKRHPEEIRNRVVSLLKEEPYLSRSDLAGILKIKETTVRYHLEALKKEGTISRIGGDRGGHWEVASNPPRSIDERSKEKAYGLWDNGLLDNFEVGTFKGLRQIHAYLFEGLYSFAGQQRRKNISKSGFAFANSQFLDDTLKQIDSMREDTFDDIMDKYVEMNIAHPFMEGNGRATRIWLDLIFKKRLGMVVDWSLVSKADYLSAMVSSPLRPEGIKALLKDALTDKIDDREVFIKGIDASYYYEEA